MPKDEEKKTCFVICPIGKQGDPKRKRSDDLLKHIITPVMKELGIVTERSDKLAQPGNIPTQIIARLYEADLVIADLTEQNANVFYELAIRHALRKPVIHMKGDGEDIPFDIHQYRTIRYDTTDYDLLEPVKEELKKQAENQLKEPGNIINPFTEALSFVKLKESSEPSEKMMADLISKVDYVLSDNERIKEYLDRNRSREGSNISIRTSSTARSEMRYLERKIMKIEEEIARIGKPSSSEEEMHVNNLQKEREMLYSERDKVSHYLY